MGGRVECKGWNLTIDFSVDVLKQEGTRRVRMGTEMREQWAENKRAGFVVPANCDNKYLVATLTSSFHRATCGVLEPV